MEETTHPEYRRRSTDYHHEMVHDHIGRITHLETIQIIHAKSITTLTKGIEEMADNFKQIKYGVLGAVALYVLDQIGLIEFIKGVI
jgi:hypothetical protein